jgi:hypothetical protein
MYLMVVSTYTLLGELNDRVQNMGTTLSPLKVIVEGRVSDYLSPAIARSAEGLGTSSLEEN